jgi:hypothetical protein
MRFSFRISIPLLLSLFSSGAVERLLYILSSVLYLKSFSARQAHFVHKEFKCTQTFTSWLHSQAADWTLCSPVDTGTVRCGPSGHSQSIVYKPSIKAADKLSDWNWKIFIKFRRTNRNTISVIPSLCSWHRSRPRCCDGYSASHWTQGSWVQTRQRAMGF